MSNNLNKRYDAYARIFKALSNPNRIKIFLKLASCCDPNFACSLDEKSVCVGELGKDLKIAASTVSHHIKELSRAGLINTERSGQTVKCWVEDSIFEDLRGFFDLSGSLITNNK